MAAISHMLETPAYSTDMLSRFLYIEGKAVCGEVSWLVPKAGFEPAHPCGR